MYTLGISCFYHDAAACLIKNNNVIAAAEEERFTRKKHDTSFPINAIEYCLKEANITSKELSYVAFYEKPLLKFERLISQHVSQAELNIIGFWPNGRDLRLLKTIAKLNDGKFILINE